MFDLQAIQNALQHCTEMHGWIFTNFSHRDTLTDSILSLSTEDISSRRWVYIIPKTGLPLKIVHSIESSILDSLPGTTKIYSGRAELLQYLHSYSGQTFAALIDADISVISTVDTGFYQTLQASNIKTLSAGTLIQIIKGLLTSKGIESHERASALLYKIIEETWDYISAKFKSETPLSEYEVLQFILHKFQSYSLVYDHEPIVAFGKNTGNPHYSVSKENPVYANKGDLIQLDIFAKESLAMNIDGVIHPSNAIFADISWVGIYDTSVPKKYNIAFQSLCQARDKVYAILKEKSQCNKVHLTTGSELDTQVRKILIDSGFENGLKHRTGHGIDTSCHGSGVNLDSIEFPDNRCILNGACFSVEPGIYFDNYGMRTEIDIYINDGAPYISGNHFNKNIKLSIPQNEILIIT